MLRLTRLKGEIPFNGETPLVIMQNVLSRRLPPISSSKRNDVPDAISAVIAKMTQKNIDDRYNSVSGLKFDLQRIKALVERGDTVALNTFAIATKDVSSYFNLPSGLIGRKAEQELIKDVIRKVSTRSRNLARQTITNMNGLGSTMSITEETKPDSGASLPDESGYQHTESSEHNPNVKMPDPDAWEHLLTETGSNVRRTQSLKESKPEGKLLDSSDPAFSASASPLSAESVNSAAVMIRRSAIKRKGHQCAVILISGSPGSGKSALLQMAQIFARQHGYYASIKFDETRKAPYEPLLRVLGSLFRQIFSEPDLDTPFHTHIRSYVRPIWSVLHTRLGLPSWLLDYGQKSSELKTVKKECRDFSSSSSSSSQSSNAAAEWLKGKPTKSSRFMSMFSGVLQVISSMRLICLGFDDLQFADQESLELINHISVANVPLIIVATSRNDMLLANKLAPLFGRATKIDLEPFTEEETIDFVCATLRREREYVIPLVAVIQEKSDGNPFFVREILETCFRKGALYYSWSESAWEYDLDKIFSEFISSDYGSQINADFVSKRLHDLPQITRFILAWASLLGSTFLYSFIKTLMSGAEDVEGKVPNSGPLDPVTGLQGALSAYIVMACDNEDRFRFAHDRYLQACRSLLNEFDEIEMHYVIAKTVVKQRDGEPARRDSSSIHMRSRHISIALDLIKQRVPLKSPYRAMLYAAAANAMDSGAKASALPYLNGCITLLSDAPWVDGEDSSYAETLKLFVKVAECFWYERKHDQAMEMVQVVYDNATAVLDMASCWIIEARVYVACGDSERAYQCLKDALDAMGLSIFETSLEECESQLETLWPALESLNIEDCMKRDNRVGPYLETLGVLLVEFSNSAFYSSHIRLFQAALLMVRVHVQQGPYPQCGIGYIHLASMILRRGKIDLAFKIANFARELFELYPDDSFTAGRGLTLHALFFGHIQLPSIFSIHELIRASDASLTSGDRIASTLNTGVGLAIRIWVTQDLSEFDVFIQDVVTELPGWETDLRGAVFIVGARQFTRALQGVCQTSSPKHVFDSDDHLSAAYEETILQRSSLPERQLFVYWTYKLMALCTYEHFDEAVLIGEKAVEISASWT